MTPELYQRIVAAIMKQKPLDVVEISIETVDTTYVDSVVVTVTRLDEPKKVGFVCDVTSLRDERLVDRVVEMAWYKYKEFVES